jgi:hypothetical protein
VSKSYEWRTINLEAAIVGDEAARRADRLVDAPDARGSARFTPTLISNCIEVAASTLPLGAS